MKFFPIAVGTIYAAFVGSIIALITGAAISGITGDFLPSFRVYEGLIGAIGGAIAGGCLVYQDKHSKNYRLALFTRVALMGIGLPILRFALYQSQEWIKVIFLLLGGGLLLIGSFLILDIVVQIEGIAQQVPSVASLMNQLYEMGIISLITYVPIGLTMILLGAYATGGVELNCHRLESSQQIDCNLTESRWLGLIKQQTPLEDVQESEYNFGVMTLTTRRDEITIVGGIINDVFVINHALKEFLSSTKPTLRVNVAPRWIIFPISLLAGGLVWLGISTDPFVAAISETDRWRKTRWLAQTFQSPLLIFGLVSCLWGISVFLLIIPAIQTRITEEENVPLLSDVTQLADMPEGTEFFVEGHISENNEIILRDFVMYAVSRYSDKGEWNPYPVASKTPPFWIDISGAGRAIDRRLRINNDTYGIDMTYNPPLEWYPEEAIEGKTLRYRGYGLGDFVTIRGHVEHIEGKPHLHAWLVYNETTDKITQVSRSGLERTMIAGGIFSTIGVILLAIFIYNLVTGFR